MKVFEGSRVPIKSWCENPEEGAIAQARNMANLPFAFKEVCLMPDTHQGYGMPVGGVLATEGVIIPNAVGVDIGCGMTAVKTNLLSIRSPGNEGLKRVIKMIQETVPVGFNSHQKPQEALMEPLGLVEGMPIVSMNWVRACHQVGTLGGGNHFIEIQEGLDKTDGLNHIWFMLHSGSRNLGKQVCDYYRDVAGNFNERWHSAVPKEWDLAFLPLDTELGQTYIREMNYCMAFAKANRAAMAERVKEALHEVTHCGFEEQYDVHHNYAAMERHYGKDVMVHRKGATWAGEGDVGIIPGSQGTKSYIVHGKGNRESFMSCSHGAGRKMGRKEAQRTLDLAGEIKRLDDLGVVHAVRTEKDLDEAPGSYKDIKTVMAEQEDLVEIMTELRPLAVVKG